MIYKRAAARSGGLGGAAPEKKSLPHHLSDFPWPFKPDLHPTADQILRYLREAVDHLQIDVRLKHEVLALEEQEDGWLVRYQNKDGLHEETFGYVVVSIGQYTEGKYRPLFPGQVQFSGEILTERDIKSLDVFDKKRVVIVGFGKSALDMAAFAAQRSQQVYHVFRTPRWLLPEWILGVHMTYALFNRFGTVMMPSWDHPTSAERFLHSRLGFFVSSFWSLIRSIFRFQIQRKRRRAAIPPHDPPKNPADGFCRFQPRVYARTQHRSCHALALRLSAEGARAAIRRGDGAKHRTHPLLETCPYPF